MKTIYTIGSSGKDAEKFFNLLINNNINTLLDVRLNNTSQLAGFTKKNDLRFFLNKICNINYIHLIDFAPSDLILKNYKKNIITWKDYESKYLNLIGQRNINKALTNIDLNNSCLLCSEKTPENCHRRLAAEFLKSQGKIDSIHHIV